MAKPKILMKQGCPFCLKFMIYAVEAGIADKMDFETAGEGDPKLDEWRATLRAAGFKPSFPAALLTDGSYMIESDALIAYFAAEHGVSAADGMLLAYFKKGVMPRMGEMYREILALKEAAISAE
jgi:hypothetical protein